jgi:hypothetical protein
VCSISRSDFLSVGARWRIQPVALLIVLSVLLCGFRVYCRRSFTNPFGVGRRSPYRHTAILRPLAEFCPCSGHSPGTPVVS